MPRFFGVKRPCIEQYYFEQFNRPNVDIVDIQNNSIKGFDETEIKMKDATHYGFEVIAVATGFVFLSRDKDIVTGAMTQLWLESINETN
ncbi:hypothetical protein GGS21DRAFT_494233 [Xylaria nigripes]|nr:hypothetical protein GGS21DRAFT_494233 [Xylaria nigripes]